MTPEAWVALIVGLLGIIGTIIAAAWGVAGQVSRAITRFELVSEQHAAELRKLSEEHEKTDERISKVEEIMVLLARQDERIKTMDERMLAQGKRIDGQDHRVDTIVQLVNDRLQAINNIVAGHTAQLAQIGRRPQG